MGLVKIYDQVVEHYSSQLLRPLKYGENAVFFWVPGAGMSTIVHDVYTTKSILAKHLSGFAKASKILFFWGNISSEKSLTGLLSSHGFPDYSVFEKTVLNMVETGREVTLAVGYIDNFPESERISILQKLLSLTSQNRRRIHIIFNSFNKPWFEQQLVHYPEFLTLANIMEIVRPLQGDFLLRYIKHYASEYGFSVSTPQIKDIAATFGGILLILREYLRSHGQGALLDTKIRNNWEFFPTTYQHEIEEYLTHHRRQIHSSAYRDLVDFGIWDIKMYAKYHTILSFDPKKQLLQVLTFSETAFWNYLSNHPNQEISKDQVISLLRPDHTEDVSLWAVDQAISRFRKKLLKCGINPDRLKTLKGKGYLWVQN